MNFFLYWCFVFYRRNRFFKSRQDSPHCWQSLKTNCV